MAEGPVPVPVVEEDKKTSTAKICEILKLTFSAMVPMIRSCKKVVNELLRMQDSSIRNQKTSERTATADARKSGEVTDESELSLLGAKELEDLEECRITCMEYEKLEFERDEFFMYICSSGKVKVMNQSLLTPRRTQKKKLNRAFEKKKQQVGLTEEEVDEQLKEFYSWKEKTQRMFELFEVLSSQRKKVDKVVDRIESKKREKLHLMLNPKELVDSINLITELSKSLKDFDLNKLDLNDCNCLTMKRSITDCTSDSHCCCCKHRQKIKEDVANCPGCLQCREVLTTTTVPSGGSMTMKHALEVRTELKQLHLTANNTDDPKKLAALAAVASKRKPLPTAASLPASPSPCGAGDMPQQSIAAADFPFRNQIKMVEQRFRSLELVSEGPEQCTILDILDRYLDRVKTSGSQLDEDLGWGECALGSGFPCSWGPLLTNALTPYKPATPCSAPNNSSKTGDKSTTLVEQPSVVFVEDKETQTEEDFVEDHSYIHVDKSDALVERTEPYLATRVVKLNKDPETIKELNKFVSDIYENKKTKSKGKK